MTANIEEVWRLRKGASMEIQSALSWSDRCSGAVRQ